MKARDVITQALRLIGVVDAAEVADANDVQASLETLNAMIDGWSTDRLSIIASTLEQFNLTPGTGTYTIGPGGAFNTTRPVEILDQSFTTQNGVDYALQVITEAQFNEIPYKAAQGIPRGLFYRPGPTVGTITLWPIPMPGVLQTISIASWKPLQAFADVDTDYTFAPGYLKAMQYNLALELAIVFARPVDPDVRAVARASKKSIKRVNAVVPILGLDGALVQRPFAGEVLR